MLVINDEQLASALNQIAEREKRPVEDVLKSMVAHYPTESSASVSPSSKRDAVQGVRHKIYAKARQYWESVGDTSKASLTDEELDVVFGAFDDEGIPRLKNELRTIEPEPGSLAYAAMIAERGDFRSGNSELARRSEEMLDEHFADDVASHKGLVWIARR